MTGIRQKGQYSAECRIVTSRPCKSATGPAFTFQQLNECRLLGTEADQSLTARECHLKTFQSLGGLLKRRYGMAASSLS